jgi:hypothetical protein
MDVIMLQGWQALWIGFLQARKNISFRLRVARRAGTGNPFHAATKRCIEKPCFENSRAQNVRQDCPGLRSKAIFH